MMIISIPANAGKGRGGNGQLLLWFSLLAVVALHRDCVKAEFNYEVEKRVLERIDDYMNGPRIANSITARYRTNGGFEHNMDARDRDAYLRFSYGLMQEFKFDLLYFGLEDGTFLGYGNGWGTYREPGNSGYAANDTSLRHHYRTCVDRETGENQNCTMAIGDKYVRCIRNCGLMKCPNAETMACSHPQGADFESAVSGSNNGNRPNCSLPGAVKWCRQYGIEVAQEGETLGFVPRTYHCHDDHGRFTQDSGRAVKEGFLEDANSPLLKLGDCEYENHTKVERFEVGPYAYCNGALCSNTFDGGYRSRDYDPRYRDWYIQTKEMQVPNWSPPYPFFSQLDLGITFSQPIYSDDVETGRQIFEGVLAIDYAFEDIAKFLVEEYSDSTTKVVVYEEADPNYIVATSTGRAAASKVSAEFPDQPCPDPSAAEGGICIVVRESMKNVHGNPLDGLLASAYNEQKARGYPRELLILKGSSTGDGDTGGADQLFIVQSSFYRPGGALSWIILVISPAGEGSTDALTNDDSLFGLVCVVASLGFCLCLTVFYLFYRQRHHRAVILADWRFTSAFLLGCALLNLSTFTLLGENTNALCMLRMWSFHFLFALALSPLFVKVWRMWRMVGAPTRRPTIVNNTTAAMLSLPIVAVQVLILTIFSFADPPHQEEIIEIEEGIVTQRIVCEQESIAFIIVMIIFEAGLVLIGCVLAYVTRNLDTQFGEAKPLMFSMYNIAFIGIITTVIILFMDIDATGQIVLRAIGVFWGTFFSSAAFVLPRLLQVKEDNKVNTSILKKSQNGTGVQKSSKVRFSLDDDKCSLHSVEKEAVKTAFQATDKKSNLTSPQAEKGECRSPPAKEQATSLAMPTKESSVDSFSRGTGWSTFEHSDPDIGIGRWSIALEQSEEFDDEGGPCKCMPTEEHDNTSLQWKEP